MITKEQHQQWKKDLEKLYEFKTENEHLKTLLGEALSLSEGWREVIAELDNMAKSESLGKAMWACLDQIDSWRKKAKAAIAAAEEGE